MPRKTVHHLVTEAELLLLCTAKDDFMVKEQAQPPPAPPTPTTPKTLHFTLVEGAFEHYKRTLEIAPQATPTPNTYAVIETTNFQVAVPFWAPVLNLLVKRELTQPRATITSGAEATGATTSAGGTGTSTVTGATHRQPWWLPAERLTARSGHIIGVLCLMSLFAGYLGTLLSQTLTYVAESFEVSRSTQGIVLLVVRVGALLSLAVAVAADICGRKSLLRLTLPGAFVLTALCALSWDIWSFAGTQTFARGLATAIALLIGVVAAEEMPAGARAYAVSVLSMSAALGAGIMVMLLPLADLDEQAWRILFLVPLLALPVLLWLLRKLPETWRFEKTQHATSPQPITTPTEKPAATPAANPAENPNPNPHENHLRHLLLLGPTLFLFLLFVTPASQFLNDFLRNERDFSGFELTAYQIFTNTPAGISLFLAGRWADLRGRRQVACFALIGLTAFTILRYSSMDWALWGWGLGASVFTAAVVPAIGVYGPELFSTAQRALFNGFLTLIGVIGSAVGVLAVGYMADHWVSFGTVFGILSFAPLLVLVLLLAAFPETARQELETLNPTDRQPPNPATSNDKTA